MKSLPAPVDKSKETLDNAPCESYGGRVRSRQNEDIATIGRAAPRTAGRSQVGNSGTVELL